MLTSLLCKYDYCGTLYKKQTVICDFTFPQLCSCDLLEFVVFLMEVSVGDSVEAVDQLGIWAKAKVVRKADNAVVINFPPWKAEWDREICDPSEIREETPEETLIPRCFSHKKVRAPDVIVLRYIHLVDLL